MDTAVQQVLRISELLELILLHLHPKDILLSQRTSSTFLRTVQGSVRLQQELFLAPDWTLRHYDNTGSRYKDVQYHKPQNNRLLLRAFPAHYPTISLVPINDAPTPEELAIGRPGLERWSWDLCISLPADAPPQCSAAVSYPNASWRRMFLCQPPCTDLYFARRWQKSLRPAIVEMEGVRMGNLYDQARCGKQNGSWPTSYISSDRDWHFVSDMTGCEAVRPGRKVDEPPAQIKVADIWIPIPPYALEDLATKLCNLHQVEESVLSATTYATGTLVHSAGFQAHLASEADLSAIAPCVTFEQSTLEAAVLQTIPRTFDVIYTEIDDHMNTPATPKKLVIPNGTYERLAGGYMASKRSVGMPISGMNLPRRLSRIREALQNHDIVKVLIISGV
ncbi:hypothetical protein LTR62_008295 [Meristemomyces frigidus]|uniref:F-box domain-containing protein n=1 Tax=Meristemomyces frigidus TaxID=1508187 RepID=A0AAN7TI73_9PEZI|nr:hypothetical protein LTR62_008295 [Meristemomyces frigidus]